MTHQPLTTEELDALAALKKAATECRCSIVPCDHMLLFRRRLEANCSRLIEQAREANDLRAAPMLSADADLMIKLGAAEQALNIHKAAFATAEAGRISYRDLFAAAESALSATRERLEIAVEHLKLISLCAGSYKKNCSHVDHEEARAALAKISAIAAKACPGGKGEEGK